MRNRVFVLFLSIFVVTGCSSSDIQKEIDNYLGKNKPQTTTIDKATDEYAGLNRHNEVRAEVFSGSSLQWSVEIAKDAQSYADTLAQSGEFKHDPKNEKGYDNGPYGENLYAAKKLHGDIVIYEEAVNNWYVEKDFYDINENSCAIDHNNKRTVGNTTYDTCGHYTQIVWKDTEYVGCGKAKYLAGDLEGGYIVVCKYKQPGNIVYRENGVDVLQKPY
jgi:pathogenesis-related protein 1